jgi:hypothetical protein
VDSALADEERLAAEKETVFILDSELDWLINPTTPVTFLRWSGRSKCLTVRTTQQKS